MKDQRLRIGSFFFLLFWLLLLTGEQAHAVDTTPPAPPVREQIAGGTDLLVPLPNITQIAAGYNHTCALTVGGGVQCWGENFYGQIGDGTLEARTLPNLVSGLSSGIAGIGANNYQSCAITTAGGVKCWGGYDYSEERLANPLPIDIQELNATVVDLAVGDEYVCALTNVGSVKCWNGIEEFNQNSAVVTSTTPVEIGGLTSGIQTITSGNSHVCVLTNAGGVKCWGENYNGQLGDGQAAARNIPQDVLGLSSGVLAVSANGNHTCAVVTGGGVKCWGYNYNGQLGDGSTSDRYQPVNVVGLSSDVVSLTLGGDHSCAITTGGGAKCWGGNYAGQLGDGSTTRRTTPVDVITLNRNVAALTAGGAHTCALLTTGAIKCWGSNGSGQLGNGTSSIRTTLIDVVGLSSGISQVYAGGDTSCAVTTGGGAKCWGENGYGQIGDGTTLNRPAPVDVINLSEVSQIASNSYHSCARTTAGEAFCWGHNYYGQLGDGTNIAKNQPTAVSGLSSGVLAVANGYYHSCALLSTGGVKCWGYNAQGQLGDNSTINRATPVDVTGLASGVKAISADGYHSCALLTSGGVRCWGYNIYGQLGDNTTINRSTPVVTQGLTTVSSLATGSWHNCAVLSSGALRCWGYNGNGQIGDSSTTSRLTPVAVSGLGSGVSNAAADSVHTCAVTTAGVVKCWGANFYGQLGDGTFTDHTTPVDVVGLSGTVVAASPGAVSAQGRAIALGYGHSCALTDSHSVKCWGANFSGQLGDSGSWRTIPEDVMTACRSLTGTHTGLGEALAFRPNNSLGCPAGAYAAGEVIMATAMPAIHWQVAGWTGTRNDASTAVTNTVFMPDGNHSVSVAYGQGCYALTLAHSGGGSDPTATPANSTSCPAGQYIAGEMINLSATPATGWALIGWSGTANDSSTSSTNTLPMPAHNHTVSALYTQPCYILTRLHSGAGYDPTATPANSPTCPAGQYVSGEAITLAATPAAGWVVSGWQGATNSSEPTTMLVMPSNDQTVNVSYAKLPDTPAPDGSDSYEEDDTCSAAKPIEPNGVGQERTFHKPGDTDWVRFDTSSGATYRIEVQVPLKAPTDVNIEVYPQCESAASDQFSATFAPGVRLDVTATSNGTFYIRLSDADPTLAGPQVAYRLSVRRLQTVDTPSTPSSGLLILVAGRLKNPDAVQKNINFVTQAVYDLYKANGYTDDAIQYLTTDPSMAGYDKPANLANLQEAIVTWAAGQIRPNQQLTIYLMDHGDIGKFYLDGVTQQILTPAQLNEWVDQFEAAAPSAKVTVIIEACYSGSFIEGVQRVSKPGRLIIASTTAATVAYASSAGAYFSDQLVASLHQGYSLHNSFRAAYAVSRELTRLQQEPWLDGNGNGIPNEAEDVALASQRGPGYADTNNNDSWAPYVVSAQGPNIITDRRGAITAEVRDNKRVRRVWAVIYPPSYRPPTNSQELIPETLPTIVLQLQSTNTFGSEYPGFDESGLYRIAVYAEDDDGLVALPKIITVQNGQQLFLPFVTQ
ncbi:MAG: hypothetical protein KF832_15355 [Caldilineaceae bacterium]|nr:hypothetical protein [Caldilineaceae bacterium]